LVQWIDLEIGRRADFGGVTLCGLGTFGFAARAILERYVGSDLNAYGCRFTSPVRPAGAFPNHKAHIDTSNI
jgi:peroxisomal enoyl-CoA hydratase 2